MNTLTGVLAALVVVMILHDHALSQQLAYQLDPPRHRYDPPAPRKCPEWPQPCWWERPPHDPAKEWRWQQP